MFPKEPDTFISDKKRGVWRNRGSLNAFGEMGCRAALIAYKSGPVITGTAVRGLEAGGSAPGFLYHLHGLLSSHLFRNSTANPRFRADAAPGRNVLAGGGEPGSHLSISPRSPLKAIC